MKKLIKEINNYSANNPFMHREPLKYRIMKANFLSYKKCRIAFSKWYPLADWQRYMWLDNDCMVFDAESTNAGVFCEAGSLDNPYFNIMYLSMMELIPKEQMENVIKGIERFRKKHSNSSAFNSIGSDARYFKEFNEGKAFSSLGSFAIKEKSNLSKYINYINFRVVNLSNSFCSLNIIVSLNKHLKDDISSYAVSHVPDQKEISGFEHKSWYEFHNLGNGCSSGRIHKYKTLELVITDINWNVMRELLKCIKSLVFQSQAIKTPCICSILTNIDGNTNSEFWSSVDVNPKFCDFYNENTACIAWRHKSNIPFFIYSSSPKTDEMGVLKSIIASHISDEMCSYLIASCVDKSIKSKLTKYSHEIANLEKKSIRHWLKSKVKASSEMFYEARFMNEYKCTVREGYYNCSDIFLKEKSVILYLYSTIENRIKDTKNFYDDIINLYQSNLDYRNAENTYNMQRLALFASSISAIIAVVAIIISLMASESAVNTIALWWTFLKGIFV